MSAIRLCLTDPSLRAAGLILALQGAVACSFGPYFSTLAVHAFGFGDRGYAVLLALAAIVSVSASVFGGIRADQTANRRLITLGAVAALILGMVLMTLTPGRWIFALTAAVLIPISSTTFGQVFALPRLAATRHPPDQRDGIMAVIRALFALPFIIVLPLWSIAFAAGASAAAFRWLARKSDFARRQVTFEQHQQPLVLLVHDDRDLAASTSVFTVGWVACITAVAARPTVAAARESRRVSASIAGCAGLAIATAPAVASAPAGRTDKDIAILANRLFATKWLSRLTRTRHCSGELQRSRSLATQCVRHFDRRGRRILAPLSRFCIFSTSTVGTGTSTRFEVTLSTRAESTIGPAQVQLDQALGF